MSAQSKTMDRKTTVQNETMTGGQMLVEALKRENVEVIFGYPGGAVLPIYDAFYNSGLRHVLTRHEQGAIHAAEGYARISGKPGVVIATSGPGATNLVTGIADAMIDSIPLVVLTGQVSTAVIGSDAFQEADVVGITMPITKHNYQVRDIKDFPRIIKEAFHIASTGRPGPVLIDIPKNIATATGIFNYEEEVKLPGYQPNVIPNILQIRKLQQAVSDAKKPVILAGAGVLFADANEELKTYVDKMKIPVANTLLGLGGFPANHELFLGMAGMHGTYTANMALYECDLIISIGARFDDRVTGNLEHFAPNAKVAHIDIDPAEIGKNVATDIPVVADAKLTLQALLAEEGTQPEHAEWLAYLQDCKEKYPLHYEEEDGVLKPQTVIEMILKATKGEAVVTTDVGQHQMWAAQFYHFNHPNRWVTSGGLGTMGFGLPAAIGAQFAEPDKMVFSVLGDAGFQMTMQELAIIRQWNLPIKVIIINNNALGMVRQWQEIFYDERYSESLLDYQPDFINLAKAFGIDAFNATTNEEAKAAIDEAMKIDGPVFINFQVAPKEKVYPMIPPGAGLHEMVGVKGK
ncbi:acetolactate synthase large subunit [Massilibacterium senegalense]|uniref:acetolactate synthase large subunit n=1 Tax=Massilibacterium senegalense TaxID=1632858 RepID=UPI0007826C71|nr:acetolactate synthase large subunit [Massilibacterium senegalense]